MTTIDGLADTSALHGARLLQHALDDLNPEAANACDTGDVEELAHLHVALTKVRQQLGTICTLVEQALVDVMPDKRIELDGLPPLERRQGTDRKAWDYEAVVSALAREAGGDLMALLEAIKECAPMTPSMQWRVGALRKHGLDPDEFCSTSPGRVSIQVHEEAAR